MQSGQRQFGVSNLEYDLVTTLSNLLQGEEHLASYAQDAEQAGDQECAQAFRTLQVNNRKSAEQFRSALARLVCGTTGSRGQGQQGG